ncbi:hypothetical protein COY62_02980 [bacterium (Candidatus Howlettbacteria) CG_4_10_14_0_8_um_filter_40_9]|nr:MAG: hypothetical protein COY62_02980 [bacterium (Candidatus Howlettbacteria) CG_4_10_14_0_8_um_filter_40_9]
MENNEGEHEGQHAGAMDIGRYWAVGVLLVSPAPLIDLVVKIADMDVSAIKNFKNKYIKVCLKDMKFI